MKYKEQVKLNLTSPPQDDLVGEIEIIEMHNSYPFTAKNGHLWRKVEGKIFNMVGVICDCKTNYLSRQLKILKTVTPHHVAQSVTCLTTDACLTEECRSMDGKFDSGLVPYFRGD